VPTIKDGPTYITQSLAIIEYLEETYPETPLLPKSRKARARVRALALSVACDIHPLNNLRVLKYLTDTLGVEDSTRMDWYRHWISTGLSALEAMLVDHPNTGSFCHGDSPGLADACLVPQIFNASRFDCDLSTYPTILRINKKCLELATFRTAAPENQPDAE
jgi:maleylpyruvate isomerase